MERKKIDISKVYANEGQIDGLPSNPRTMRKEKFRKLVKSIRELPEMTEARDLLVVPHGDGYVVIGGNMRLAAYRELGWKEVPCCILPPDTPPEKLRQMLIQDNNPFGDNDWDALANEWDAEELDDWGFDVWQEPKKEAPKPAKAKEEEKKEEEENFDIASLMLADRIYDSDNAYDIPTLRIDRQPNSGLLLPFSGFSTWRTTDSQQYGKTRHWF